MNFTEFFKSLMLKNGQYATKVGDVFSAAAQRFSHSLMSHGLSTRYEFECRDRDGNLKWADGFSNLVTNAGLDDNLEKYFKGSAYTAAFYVGLISGTPTVAAADTMSSHAGWTEVIAYDEAVRQTLTLGSVSGQSVSNTASKATFTISTNSTTIGGAFMTTGSAKSGTTGVLYGVGAFAAGNKVLDDGDTLTVTITLSASSA